MPILGAFLGGPEPEVAAGFTGVSLCVNTRDRQNLSTASFRVTNAGYSQTFNADSTGRAFAIVPSTEVPYQVDLIHDGEYINDDPQQFIARSGEHVGVFFDLYNFSENSTYLKVITEPGNTVTISSGSNTETMVAEEGVAVFTGLPVDSTWSISAGGEIKTITIRNLYTEIKVGAFYVFGVRIKISESDPESACEYTDDAIGLKPASRHDMNDWGNTPLFKEIKPVVLTSGPTKTYLDIHDLTKTIAGVASNISEYGNNAMVEFPRWYMYINNDGEYITIKYCKRQLEGFYSYAHTQSGQLQTHFYIGCFAGCVNSGKLHSVIGVHPSIRYQYGDIIRYAQSQGTGFDIFTWFQHIYISGLVLLAYKTLNPQKHLRGNVDGTMIMNSSQPFDNDFGILGSASGKERMSFLWVHDLWGNAEQALGRAFCNSDGFFVLKDGYSSVTESDYERITSIDGKRGYVSKVDGGILTGFLPKEFSGSSTTFWCDYGGVYIDATYFPTFGGYYGRGDEAGPFNIQFGTSDSGEITNGSSRLSYCLGIA